LQYARYGFLGCVFAAVLAAGCSKGGGGPGGGKGARVQGRLLDNGRPVKVLPNEEVVVSFTQAGSTDPLAPRGASPIDPKDGSFAFTGPSSTVGMLPPGRYRVSVASQIGGGDGRNRFAPTFDEDRTPLVADVGAEETQTFVIDIGKKTVTKQ
jgi:hypothetical protein